MSGIKRLEAVLPVSVVNELRDGAEAAIRDIYEDYFSDKSFEEYQRAQLSLTPSLVMKLATYRFMSGSMLTQLKTLVSPIFEEIYKQGDFLLHPIFYLRLSYPGVSYSSEHRRVFLDTQPHYDRSFGIEAFTCWIPLDKIDHDSGGLCWFSGDDIQAQFPMESRNRHNYITYIQAAPELDPVLMKGTIAPEVHIGDVLTFDSRILHGATRPKSRRRISFDFRLVPAANLAMSPGDVQKLFHEMNASIDLCNVNHLLLLGDFTGAARKLRQLGSAKADPTLSQLASALELRAPDLAILEDGSLMAWQNEYRWLKSAMS